MGLTTASACFPFAETPELLAGAPSWHWQHFCMVLGDPREELSISRQLDALRCPQSSPALPAAGFLTAAKPHKARGWLTPEHGDITTQEVERLQRGSACNAGHRHSPAYQGVLTQTTNKGKKNKGSSSRELAEPNSTRSLGPGSPGCSPQPSPGTGIFG